MVTAATIASENRRVDGEATAGCIWERGAGGELTDTGRRRKRPAISAR